MRLYPIVFYHLFQEFAILAIQYKIIFEKKGGGHLLEQRPFKMINVVL